MLLRVNMEDLREQTHARHYELYRRCKMEEMGFKDSDPDSQSFRWNYRAVLQCIWVFDVSGEAKNPVVLWCQTALINYFIDKKHIKIHVYLILDVNEWISSEHRSDGIHLSRVN